MNLRPQNAPLGKKFEEWITAGSMTWQRAAAVQMTRYLCLEADVRQDLEEDETTWRRDKTEVYAISEDIICKDGKERNSLVGIVTFHQFNKNPILYYCYLHPFFRGKGKMLEAWTAVRLKFPQFEVEPPLSPAMERFMRKVDCSHVLRST